MRIPSGKTDQNIYFVAVDSADLVTRKTGLTSFTVYRSRNGGTATVYTTPTITELSAANMPGVYAFTIDEDTTIASTSDSEEYCVHITQASMAPVTRVIELFRRDTSSGTTALVDANGRVDVIKVAGTTQTARDLGASVLISSGTGTGQLSVTAGVIASNTTQIAGSAVSTSTAQLGVNVVNAAGTAWGSGAITSGALAAGANQAIADALLDRTAGVDTGLTPRQWLRLAGSVLFGKASGLATTTAVYRDFGDTKARVTATVDANGNRTAVTTDST